MSKRKPRKERQLPERIAEGEGLSWPEFIKATKGHRKPAPKFPQPEISEPKGQPK